MSSPGFFELHITTHQRGSSEIDYRAVHKRMVAHGFKRVIQTTAQIANEVPGVYRLYQAQLSTAEVAEMIRLALAPLNCGSAVQLMKIEEELLLDFIPLDGAVQMDTRSRAESNPQSGYPAWKRPR